MSLPKEERGCIQHQCVFFDHVLGVDALGKEVDLWDCSLKWGHRMTQEVAGKVRGVQAAVGDLIAVVKKQTQMFFAAMSDEAQARVAATPAAPQLTGDQNAGSDQVAPHT